MEAVSCKDKHPSPSQLRPCPLVVVVSVREKELVFKQPKTSLLPSLLFLHAAMPQIETVIAGDTVLKKCKVG